VADNEDLFVQTFEIGRKSGQVRIQLGDRSANLWFRDGKIIDVEVGALAGEAFADRPERLRLRLATSLLYGVDDAERWQTLAATDPTGLPWVRSGIERLGAALSGLSP